MHIILTHEQADFDAIASQLEAALLVETAIPVLPQRLNRNVRAFLAIYGGELPFIERRDLPKEDIKAITLVDTQSMVSLKGMRLDTRVRVIDHHDLRSDLPADWQVTVEPTGANATLLVEALRERNLPLTPLEATLMLLGIYEDTGSLTYTRTTPRDLNAAAYLLASGASLGLASDYLNHPLTLAQQALYDRLRQDVVTHMIHGHTVLVGTGDARHMDEELSTVAHKLRDLLDPDGLFLLIYIRGGIQLIARSTNDHINVAEIAAEFGGGGHSRAAAAMIKREDIENVLKELLEVLDRLVHPAITVGQIMSRGPKVISADAPIEEAVLHMQRYGYEGYPVVQDGRLVGLLTRRAVDRATSHKLNLPVDKLMDAGAYVVHPGDSIERLQQVMVDSGWGQIPVQQPETGEIIGIVTRTDLIKTLAPVAGIPGQKILAARLERALPPVHLALLKAAARAAVLQRKALYIVGGFVRDLLLERPSLDFDLVVEGDAIAVARSLAREFGGRVTAHTQFGTAKWILDENRPALAERLIREMLPEVQPVAVTDPLPDTVDLITARTEFYTHPTALPTVEHGSIKLDLHRRDFTINTLALRLDGHHYGELHDYWGGLNDLQQGVIRVLHSVSFVDDPTRILRAVRFEQRFGFRISERTLELMQSALQPPEPGSGQSLLDRVSGDRIRHELDHIIREPHAARMLSRLAELGILAALHPDLPWDATIQERFEELPRYVPGLAWNLGDEVKGVPLRVALGYALWFLRLSASQVESIGQRLKIPVGFRAVLVQTGDLWRALPGLRNAPPSLATVTLDEYPALSIYAAWVSVTDDSLRRVLWNYAHHWKQIMPVANGDTLRKLGLHPGPVYKTILDRLRQAWLDGEVKTREEEEKLLEKMVVG